MWSFLSSKEKTGNFILDCPCILDKQIKARPTRCSKWWFIGNQLFFNVFRASLRPSSGEQTVCHCLWFPVLTVVVVVPESWVARCVHCAHISPPVSVHRMLPDQTTSSAQCTHLATRLSGTTTPTARTGNHRQWHAVCCPDDGRKDAPNMLRNNWLPLNHHLLHLVGLAFKRQEVWRHYHLNTYRNIKQPVHNLYTGFFYEVCLIYKVCITAVIYLHILLTKFINGSPE